MALVFISAAYFHGGAASNQNARLDAVFGFVEPGPHHGTFRIDRFLLSPERDINTADWARAGDHYYANKAPGSILLGAAIYTVVYAIERVLCVSAGRNSGMLQLFNAYMINVGVSALALAVLALCMFRLLRVRASPLAAALLSLGACLGTGLFPYATQLWGHVTAAAFVMLGLYALRDTGERAAFWGALWLGAAVVVDYLAIIAAIGLVAARAIQRPRELTNLVFGASPAAAVLLLYQWLCFGSPWTLATSASNPMYLDPKRALGIFGAPDLGALWQLTFGLQRGLFVQMPVLLLTLVGIGSWWRRTPRDPWLWTHLGAWLSALLAVACFNGWHGGASVCARYMLPFLPLLLVALRELDWTRRNALLALGLGGLSVFNMLAIAAVNPLCPDAHPNPLYDYTYGMLFAGHVAPYPFPIRLLQLDPHWHELRQWAMWNWGEWLGLRGASSLLPLLAAWLLGAIALWSSVLPKRDAPLKQLATREPGSNLAEPAQLPRPSRDN